MPRPALTVQQKRKEDAKEDEARLLRAVSAYAAEQLSAKAENRRAHGVKYFGQLFDVSPSTIQRRAAGGQSMADFNATKRHMLPGETDMVLEVIGRSADRADPLTNGDVAEQVDTVLGARLGRAFEGVGVNWVSRFKAIHSDKLASGWSSSLDTVRANCLNPKSVKEFHEAAAEIIVGMKIPPENIFQVDETGFQEGVLSKIRIVKRKGTKTQHMLQDGNRENITVVETICADGTVLPPMVIFKGVNLMRKWAEYNPCGAHVAVSLKGYIDAVLGVKWLETFIAQTHGKSNSARVVLLDGHVSHYTIPFITLAREHNIYVLSYPPHSTHAMQGLDVVMFGIYKRNYAKEKKKWLREKGYQVGKEHFLTFIDPVRKATFTQANILRAFEKVGIHPWDPTKITVLQMAPSEENSVTGAFPLPQNTPVRTMMAAMHQVSIPSLLDSISESPASSPPTSPAHIQPITPPVILPSAPAPSAKQVPAATLRALDPSLFTPSKRGAAALQMLASSSVPFLAMDGSKLTSSDHIPPPVFEKVPAEAKVDWSVLNKQLPESATLSEVREESQQLRKALTTAFIQQVIVQHILQGANAQLAIQYLYVEKLRMKLYAKEGKRSDDRERFLSQAVGRHFTSDAFLQLMLDREAARLEKEVQARERESLKELRVERDLWIEEEKRTRALVLEADRREYAGDVAWCKAEGLAKPAPRKQYLKRRLPARFDVLKRKGAEEVAKPVDEVPGEEGNDEQEDERLRR